VNLMVGIKVFETWFMKLIQVLVEKYCDR
jgi:hypothetical protein